MDHLTVARIDPEPRSISIPDDRPRQAPTARRLVAASISPNTRESYRRALRQFDTWRGRRPPDDSTLAAYLAVVYDAGRSPSVAALAVAAARFRARLSDHPDPAGNATGRVLAGFRRTAAARRGRLDAVIAGLLFMAGLRRSEVAALRWSDLTDADAPTSGTSRTV